MSMSTIYWEPFKGKSDFPEPFSPSLSNKIQQKSCQCPLRKKFQEMFNEGRWCDFTVEVEERNFDCHSIVLISISQYFDGLLRSNPSAEFTALTNISSEIFDEILKFAYSDEKPAITGSNIYDFFCASDFLGIPALIDYCEQYIYDHLSSIENIFEIFSFARAINNEIMHYVLDYIVENFNALSQKEEFLTMSLNDLLVVLYKYTSPNQNLDDPAALSRIFRDEDLLLDLMIRWLKEYPEDRTVLVRQIRKIVDLRKVSPHYLELLAKKCELDSSVDAVSLKESVYEHLSSYDLFNSSMISPEPARNSGLHVYMHHITKNSKYYSTQWNVFSTNKYNPTWTLSGQRNPSYMMDNLSNIITLQGESSNTLYGLDFVSNYGHGPMFYSSTSIMLDTRKILVNPPMEEYFDFFDMCGMQNSSKIYSYFYEDDAKMAKIMEYNCQRDFWSPVPLREEISRSCMLADNNLLYLIGGYHPNVSAQCVQIYDPRAPNWMKISKTNNRHYYAAGASLHGKIYICDGLTTEVLDPVAGKWETLSYANPITDTADFEGKIQMVAHDEKLWLICSTQSALESYDDRNMYAGANTTYEYVQEFYTHVIDPRDETSHTSKLLDEVINKSYKFNPMFESTRRFLQGIVVF